MSDINFLLIPGFMTDEALWSYMAADLSDIGQISFGKISNKSNLKDLALDILGNAPPVFVLIGFSLGGYISRWIEYLAPDRVAAMILISTSNNVSAPRNYSYTGSDEKKLAGFKGLSAKAIQSSLHVNNKNNTFLINYIKEMSVRLGAGAFICQSRITRSNPTRIVAYEHCPVLIIASQDDELRPFSDAEHLHREYPDSQLIVIHNAGHMLPLEEPKQVVQAISRWLELLCLG